MIHGNHSSAVREVIPAHDDKRVLARSDKYCPEGRFYALRPFQNIIALLIFSFLALSCHTGTEPANSNIQLTAADIGVTDAYVRLTTAVPTGADTLVLRRDGITILTLSSSYFDTVLHFDSLLPRHSYRYTGYAVRRGRTVDSSNVLVMTTLDTTSHDFHFEVDTLGDGANSILHDVAIINDTTIIAVGEIYLRDSTGHFNTTPFNIAKWNGVKWKYLSITYFGFSAIYAFSSDDYWVDSWHWNGKYWTAYNITNVFDGDVSKIWGTSSNNMFIVGTNGAIAHFNGQVWEKMESGTNVDLYDVWGTPDGSTVWACGYYYSKRGTFLLEYTTKENRWKIAYDGTNKESEILSDSLSGTFTSIYAASVAAQRLYVISTSGLFQTSTEIPGSDVRRYSFTNTFFPGFPHSIRGNGVNDMVIAGERGMIAHFNGISMRYYDDFYGNCGLTSCAQSRNLIITVGYTFDPININGRGIAIIGRR